MKILVAGVPFYSSFTWSISQALIRAGHEIVNFNYRKNSLLRIPGVRSVLSKVVMQKRLIETVKKEKPELLFICKGELIKHQTIRAIKENHTIKIVNWFPDPRLFAYENIFKSLPFLDGIFTKNLDDVERAKLLNLHNVYLLNHCADIELHKSPVTIHDGSFDNSIAFVGSYYPYRDCVFKELIEYNLKVWGRGWEKSLLYKKKPLVITGKEARDLEQGKIFLNSTINLNIHHYDDCRAVNQRVFDICGSGGFQLTDFKSEISLSYEIGKELETYTTFDELKEKIEYFLAHPGEAREIGKRAGEKTMKMYTYDHRVKEILSQIGEL